MNKTVKIVLSVLIFLVIGVLITVFALNFKTITSGSQLYTYDQVQEAYNDGLEENKNLLDKKDEQIEIYKNQLFINYSIFVKSNYNLLIILYIRLITDLLNDKKER